MCVRESIRENEATSLGRQHETKVVVATNDRDIRSPVRRSVFV